MKINIVSKSGIVPKYETEGSAGMDLRAYLDEPMILKPMERKLVPTGLFIELPMGYEGQVRARSGLAIKKGIGLVNSIGTIDSDYRGEIGAILFNHSNKTHKFKKGDRIAQMVVMKVPEVEVYYVKNITKTRRHEGRFGSSGLGGNNYEK